MTLIRSLVFNLAYYVATAALVIVSLPVFAFGSPRACSSITRTWAHIGTFLLRSIVGTRFVVRGLEHVPPGGAIIAPKHQSMFETFAFFPILDRTTYVMKQELSRIPLWGWYARRAGMIMVERDQGTSALRRLADEVGKAIKVDRQVIIFPEGTRNPPGAASVYKGGIAHLYRLTGVSVVPVALNSGLFWPRRRITRYPGTIIMEFLPPIPPGLKTREFLARLKDEIDTASDLLLVEGSDTLPHTDLPPTAVTRLAELSRR